MARNTVAVLGVDIDRLDYATAVEQISSWGRRRQSRYVCICNVHSVMTARDDPELEQALPQADMATADGAPIAWFMRRQGASEQRRVCGPDLMWQYCQHAARQGESIFLYGSTPPTLDALAARLTTRFPGLRIAGSYSPPFRPVTEAEDTEIVDLINDSGATTVWIGLGCPKQELWMARHRGRVNAPMIGVGAAFDFHAGTVRRAPAWMRSVGLEWAHRLFSEPRRLWRRYLTTNSRFLLATLCSAIDRRATDRTGY